MTLLGRVKHMFMTKAYPLQAPPLVDLSRVDEALRAQKHVVNGIQDRVAHVINRQNMSDSQEQLTRILSGTERMLAKLASESGWSHKRKD